MRGVCTAICPRRFVCLCLTMSGAAEAGIKAPVCDGGSIRPEARRRLQRGLDGLEQLEAHRAIVAPQRDHETHLPVRGGIGVTRQCADAIEGARLVQAAIMAAKQVRVRREKVEYLGETARREAVAAADARAFFEMDSFGKTVRSQVLVRDL